MRNNFLKILVAIALVFGLNKSVNAQANYNTGVGLRLGGYENGITLKYFMDAETALEGIIGFRPGVFVVTGFYEKHAIAFAEPSLTWYYGAGAHIGGISENRYYRGYGEDRYYKDNGILLGVDGVLGLEYQIPDIPISAGVDLHPRIELARGPFLDLEAALSVRYTF